MNEIKTFEEAQNIIKKEFVMVIAKSHNCGVCETILNSLQDHVPSIDKIEKHIIYIDDVDQFRGEHLIFSVPSVLIFSEGKELLRESRYINYPKVERLIDLYSN